MSKPLIELTTCPEGDWEILELDVETEWSGHSLRNSDWIELLKCLGYEVVRTEITDEEMEMRC